MNGAPVLQTTLVEPPWELPNGLRLPGTSPIGADDWLRWDDAFAGQMAIRDGLIAEQADAVHALLPGAEAAAREILVMTLDILRQRSDYHVSDGTVRRPDDADVDVDWDAPLKTLGRLVQEDICLMEEQDGVHVLTGAVLCFPASWTLAEKIGRPLIGIHEPVPSYNVDIATRVQRLFNAIRVGQPIRRSNCLLYEDPTLFQPRTMDNRRVRPSHTKTYVRTERQCLLRLPETGAVVFTIHTCVVARQTLSTADEAALSAHLASDPARGTPT